MPPALLAGRAVARIIRLRIADGMKDRIADDEFGVRQLLHVNLNQISILNLPWEMLYGTQTENDS
jgi:hypothetical protein